MPIDDATWEEGNEQDSTASQLYAFLHSNGSDAYTVDELVTEIGPDDPSEGVISYYRALLELLADTDRIAKRRITVDGGVVPYYRAIQDEQRESDEVRTDAEWFPSGDTADEKRETAIESEQPLTVDIAESIESAQPLTIDIAERNTPLSVRSVDSEPETETPFFIRWYRWYQKMNK